VRFLIVSQGLVRLPLVNESPPTLGAFFTNKQGLRFSCQLIASDVTATS